ncbi:hypothetical protein DFH09DRAFT_1091543 [Mycena vulgaris]|nr:hypothetical protein DFH09DRAFT_1091543 [Mycena vulgaris]
MYYCEAVVTLRCAAAATLRDRTASTKYFGTQKAPIPRGSGSGRFRAVVVHRRAQLRSWGQQSRGSGGRIGRCRSGVGESNTYWARSPRLRYGELERRAADETGTSERQMGANDPHVELQPLREVFLRAILDTVGGFEGKWSPDGAYEFLKWLLSMPPGPAMFLNGTAAVKIVLPSFLPSKARKTPDHGPDSGISASRDLVATTSSPLRMAVNGTKEPARWRYPRSCSTSFDVPTPARRCLTEAVHQLWALPSELD